MDAEQGLVKSQYKQTIERYNSSHSQLCPSAADGKYLYLNETEDSTRLIDARRHEIFVTRQRNRRNQ